MLSIVTTGATAIRGQKPCGHEKPHSLCLSRAQDKGWARRRIDGRLVEYQSTEKIDNVAKAIITADS